MSAPPPTTSAAASRSRGPIRSDLRRSAIEMSTAKRDSVATSGATIVTRPRSNAE